MDNPFLFLRYSQEEHNYVDFLKGGKNYDLGKSWFRNDTINAWRQNRMYQTIDPFLNAYSNQKWLTIGDGRYGSDANYIKKKEYPFLQQIFQIHSWIMQKRLVSLMSIKKKMLSPYHLKMMNLISCSAKKHFIIFQDL